MRRRVAIYTRTAARDPISADALKEQEQVCRSFATKQGWDVVAVYADHGFSGTRADRPGLQRLLEVARMGEVDTIVVMTRDRLARSLALLQRLQRSFSRSNVRMIAVEEPT
jgi:site-specific DNA recombinase